MSTMSLLIIFIVFCLGLVFAIRNKKNVTPKITEEQKQVDMLITVILPTINNDK